jgi:hypothetical protein
MRQHIYILEILQEFGLTHCNATTMFLLEGFKLGKEENSKPIDLLTF